MSDWSDDSDWSDKESDWSDRESDRRLKKMRERLALQSTTALSPGDDAPKTDFTAMG